MPRLPSEVHITRGPLVESRHRIHAVVTEAAGRVVASVGDPALVTYWRSCAKLFQVMPLVEGGGLERLGWDDAALTLACASHGGEPEHLALAQQMLRSLGLDADALACGPSAPLSARGRALWEASGQPLSALHNNCSGKHAAMLALATLRGWPTAGYHEATHPVQQMARDTVAAWTGVAAAQIPVGVDGCGVSVFGLPLQAMATAYAKFGAAAAAGEGTPARILTAIRRHPHLLAGTDRFDSVLVAASDGALVAKIGADGVHCVTDPSTGLGVALKIEDGSVRVQHAALVAVLQAVDLLPATLTGPLAGFANEPVLNTRHETIGWIRAADPG
jgi:L-asparaginase II